MSVKLTVATVASLVIVGGATTALATESPTLSAKVPAETTAHAMHLRVVFDTSFNTPNGYVAASKDFNANGDRVGSDVTTCRGRIAHPQRARCDVGLALSRGMLHITFTETAHSSVARGRVTGGTGYYQGARGTVRIEEQRRHADVTISYQN